MFCGDERASLVPSRESTVTSGSPPSSSLLLPPLPSFFFFLFIFYPYPTITSPLGVFSYLYSRLFLSPNDLIINDMFVFVSRGASCFGKTNVG